MNKYEQQLRINLAALYRLIDLYGMSDLVYTHITAKIPNTENHFLINPYGLMFDEITASNLVKVDDKCNKLDNTESLVNPAGFLIHSEIHRARPDIICVLHTHTRAGVAISAQKHGLLPISQQSTFVLNSLAYHDYEGVVLHDSERDRLRKDISDKTFLILRNHGLLVVGQTIPSAFLSMYMLEAACKIQVDALSGSSELIKISQTIIEKTPESVKEVSMGLGPQLVWPALLRKLDKLNPGYRN